MKKKRVLLFILCMIFVMSNGVMVMGASKTKSHKDKNGDVNYKISETHS